jgi:3-dehydroquinate synthase
MKCVPVALGSRSYDVLIAPGLLAAAGEHVARHARDARVVIVSDETVWRAQGATLSRGLHPLTADPILIPPGEGSKSWSQLAALVDALLARGIERRDCILAFGGGVVGDLVGFAAAILKRGCRFIQIPTSLLAQVDSSVGGKTGINVAAGKNMVGAFHHPALVLIDPDVLDTLPERHQRAGYAEVVKYGLIGDPAFFAWCEAHGGALLAGDTQARQHAIAASVAAKAAIVAADERETTGRRALLNLGHTFGHALEAETGFSNLLVHGEAVAVGTALAFRFSSRLGLCPLEDADRVEAHLRAMGLPTEWNADPTAMLARMRDDKKASGGRLALILARGIGHAFVEQDVDGAELEAFLAERSGMPERSTLPS